MSLRPVSRVRTIQRHDGNEIQNELSFEKDEIIDVLDASETLWWRGELNGKIGFFPVDYVRPADDPEKPERSSVFTVVDEEKEKEPLTDENGGQVSPRTGEENSGDGNEGSSDGNDRSGGGLNEEAEAERLRIAQEEEVRQVKAAIIIQKIWRGFVQRRKWKEFLAAKSLEKLKPVNTAPLSHINKRRPARAGRKPPTKGAPKIETHEVIEDADDTKPKEKVVNTAFAGGAGRVIMFDPAAVALKKVERPTTAPSPSSTDDTGKLPFEVKLKKVERPPAAANKDLYSRDDQQQPSRPFPKPSASVPKQTAATVRPPNLPPPPPTPNKMGTQPPPRANSQMYVSGPPAAPPPLPPSREHRTSSSPVPVKGSGDTVGPIATSSPPSSPRGEGDTHWNMKKKSIGDVLADFFKGRPKKEEVKSIVQPGESRSHHAATVAQEKGDRKGSKHADVCSSCHGSFGWFSSKGVCKNCNKVFCSKCLKKKKPIPRLNITSPTKVCNQCYDQL